MQCRNENLGSTHSNGGREQLVTKRSNAQRCFWSRDLTTLRTLDFKERIDNEEVIWGAYPPKSSDSGVRIVVYSSVDGILTEIIDIDRLFCAPDEDLKFLLVEHSGIARNSVAKPLDARPDIADDVSSACSPEPLWVNDVGQPIEECLAL